MEFFSTFGGNNVSCAIGLAVLQTVLEEDLQSHAESVGSQLLQKLRELMTEFDIIGDVRGSGLFLGVELVRDRNTKEPATEEATSVVNEMREQGILLGTDGPFHNVLKIRPPMPFTISDGDRLVETLAEVLSGRQ
jgi:4-aminobutyrate aminotransferase-like enzyme